MTKILKKIFTSFVILSFLNSITFAQSISNNALPTNPTISSGSANISQTTNKLTVNQNTDKLITNWSSFNIGKDATVQFVQPSSTSSALNRVTSSDPSYIFGTLQANGKIILVNPNGVLFANGAKVDVGSIIASTLKTADKDFLSDQLIFEKDNLAGTIQNDGTIRAFAGGTVALIGSQVTNNGKIKTKQGNTALLAGDKVTLTLNGNRFIKYNIDEGALNSLVENNNAIIAKEGVVILSAKALNLLSKSSVNNTGNIEAKGFSQVGGKIYLDGDQTTNSGKLVASSKNNSGGLIQVTGEEVKLTSTASLDASGATGGGTVLVGGDYQGKNPLIKNASLVNVEKNAVINVSAKQNGDGGKAIFWADKQNNFEGQIFARGGVLGGNGGFAEVSSKGLLNYNGITNTLAPLGITGTLLLDPTSYFIGTSTAAADSNHSILSIATLNTNLSSTNQTITASNDIDFAGDLSFSGSNTSSLILDAPVMVLGGSISVSGTGILNVNLGNSKSANNLWVSGSNRSISTNNGTISISGNIGGAQNLTLNSGTAATTLNNATGNLSGTYWPGTASTNTITSGSSILSYNPRVNGDLVTIDFGNGTISAPGGFSVTPASIPNYINTGTGSGGNTDYDFNGKGGTTLSYKKLNDATTYTASITSGGHVLLPENTNIDYIQYQVGSSNAVTISAASTTTTNTYDSSSINTSTLNSLDITSSTLTAANITLNSNNSLSITNSGTGSITGVIAGSGATLTKAGAGTLTLSGSNTYTGATTINAGTIAITNGSALGGSSSGQGTTVASGATLGISGGITVAEPITISGTGASGGAINFTGGNNTYSGSITLAANSTINSTSGQQTISSVINGTNANSQALTVTTSDALTLSGGSVGQTTSLSTFNASTTSGNLTLGENIKTGNTGSSSIVLNAGSSASVGGTGSTSSGNIIISGSPTLTTGSGGSAKLFTGSIADSTGLTSFIGSGSGKFRYNSDETTTNYSTALSSGNYAIYRQQPTATITANNQNITYGDTVTNSATVSSLQNGDSTTISSDNAVASVSYSTSGSASNGNYDAGVTHTITPSSATGGLGYAFSYSTGSLTVGQKALTIGSASADNKIYDGTDTATINSIGSLSGFIGSETVTASATSGTFSDKNVANGKTVSVAYSLSNGSNNGKASNYSLANSTTTANITAKALTASGLSGVNKTYDGTTTASLTGSAALQATESAGAGTTSDGKPYSVDSVSISGTATGTFTDRNVADARTVNISGLSLTGTGYGNYTLTAPTTSANITAKALTASGLSGVNKTYDGTTTASLTGSAALQATESAGAGTTSDGKPYSVDSVSISGTATGTFTDRNVADARTVNISGLSLTGTGYGNYTLTAPTTSANITAKALTASISSASSTYGSTTTPGTLTLTGIVESDSVSGSAVSIVSPSYSTSNNLKTGTYKQSVTSTLSGTDAGNYTLTGGYATTDNNYTVNAKALTISGITASDKDYDGTRTATVSTSGVVYSGKVSGDSVTVSATGTFQSASAGRGKTVNLTSTYSGTDVSNYNITGQSTTTANINSVGDSDNSNSSNSNSSNSNSNSSKVRCELTDCNKDKLSNGEIVIVRKNTFTSDNVKVTPVSIKPEVETRKDQAAPSLIKIIVLKPGQEPKVDKEYEVSIRGNDAILKEQTDIIDKTIINPGKSIGSARFSIENDKGKILEYNMVVRESGLEIRPLSFDALLFADKNKATVAGAAMIDVANNLKLPVDGIKTILFDLIIDKVFEDAMFNQKDSNRNIFNINYY